MWFIHLLFALIIGLLLAAIFAGVSRRRGWDLFWMFFLIVFLGSWAGGVWIRPFGPAAYGVYWMPVLFVGVIISLLLVVLLPSPPPRETADTVELVEAGEEASSGGPMMFGPFFWLLLAVLVVTIGVGYLV